MHDNFLAEGQKGLAKVQSPPQEQEVRHVRMELTHGMKPVSLRFRKSFSGHYFQAIWKLPSNAFNYHTGVF